MAISHNQKVAILDKMSSDVASQKAVMLITTKDAESSLDAQTNVKFRKEARSKGVVVKVVKNTLIKKAFEVVPELTGPTYVAFLENKEESDEVTVPKIICELVKDDFKENFNIIGSVVDSEFLDSAETIVLSKTLTKEESLAQVAGSLNQLATKLAIAINELPSGVVRGVSEYSKTLK